MKSWKMGYTSMNKINQLVNHHIFNQKHGNTKMAVYHCSSKSLPPTNFSNLVWSFCYPSNKMKNITIAYKKERIVAMVTAVPSAFLVTASALMALYVRNQSAKIRKPIPCLHLHSGSEMIQSWIQCPTTA